MNRTPTLLETLRALYVKRQDMANTAHALTFVYRVNLETAWEGWN